MKIRLKEQAEYEFDKDDVEEKQLKMNVAFKDFMEQFIDCEGDVFYSTAMMATNALYQHKHAVENAAMTRVGPEWDHDKGIVGKWRYPHLRKGND